jgi:hypothetical protein
MAKANFAVKRTCPRFPFSADAEVTLRDGTFVAAQVLELSARGCYIDALEPIPVGTELHLRIHNGVSVCQVPAKVIYMQPGYGMAMFGMGVAFENKAAEHQPEIESWLRNLASQPTQNIPN